MTLTAALDPATLARIAPLVEQLRVARREEQALTDGAGAAGGGAGEGAPGSSAPEMSDEKIRAGTGRGWDEWVALAAAGPGREASHTEIATWVGETYEIPGWWAHGVAVGVRRLTGQRVPGQMADGSYAVSRTKTLPIAETDLREILLDTDSWSLLLPGLDVTLRSKATTKSPRFAITDDGLPVGSVLVTLGAVGTDRCRTTMSHEKLASSADGDLWKAFWGDWLQVLDDALGG